MTTSNVVALQRAAEKASQGIQSSADHAESDSPGWQDRALAYMTSFAAYAPHPWTVETFRAWAAQRGLDKPADERAYGAVTMRALRMGVMVRVGFAPTASSHCGAKPLYARPVQGKVA